MQLQNYLIQKTVKYTLFSFLQTRLVYSKFSIIRDEFKILCLYCHPQPPPSVSI